MSEKPKVSYICSVRDGAKELRRCAMSVLGQSVSELELILVDDHSEDETWATIQSLAAADPRVRGVKNQGMKGLTYSLNMGLDFARGEFVARIDADDFAHRERTRIQLEAMLEHPEAAMCSSCFRLADPEDWEMYCHCPSFDPKILKWSLCFRNNIRHSTVMWRRSLDFRYEPSFTYAQDYELWCRISRVGDIRVAPEVIATLTSHPTSITNTKLEEQEGMADRVAADQYEFYTGARITPHQGRHLRMVHYLKSPEQFKVFDNITPYDFEEAVERYCRLAEAFFNRESPDEESIMAEIGRDMESLMCNPKREKEATRAVRKVARLFGRSSLVHRIDKRFVKSSAKVH
jgi:glycosyltransferase involved in cell wall biosynthesis